MGTRSIEPPFEFFFDEKGKALEAGYIYIGTVNLDPVANPISIYWDAALTIPITQPIRTVAGVPSNNGAAATIYAASDYSIEVRNKNQVMVYESPSDNQRVSPSIINYTNSKTGAVSRTLQSRLEDYTSAKDFGAPTGGDDSAALQAAIDATPAGGKLYLPVGTYAVATGLTRSTPISIIGDGIEGNGGTVISYTGSGVAMTFDTSQNGLFLSNFRIAGTSSGTDGILIKDGFNNIMLFHMVSEGFSAGNGLRLNDTFDITIIGGAIRQNSININTDIGDTFGTVNAVSMYGVGLADAGTKGVVVNSGAGWVIDRCDFSGLATNAIGIDFAPGLAPSASANCRAMDLTANFFESATGATNCQAVRIGAGATVSASLISHITIDGSNEFDVGGDQISMDVCRAVFVQGNAHGALESGKKNLVATANSVDPDYDIVPFNSSNITDNSVTKRFSGNDRMFVAEHSGNYTSPERSAVLVHPTANLANKTGDGTVFTMEYGTEVTDTQGEFNTSTFVFTAQKSGTYRYDHATTANNAAGLTYEQIRLVTSNDTFDLYFGKDEVSGTLTQSGGLAVYMDANDTSTITCEIGGLGGVTAGFVASGTFLSITYVG